MDRIAALFSSPGPLGLAAHVAAVGACLLLSIVVLAKAGSGFGAEAADGPRGAPWTPPGVFIGAVWTVLYTLMAVALWLVNRMPAAPESLAWLLVALIGLCIVWPFYAFDTPSRWPGLLGNLGILALALLAVGRLWPFSPPAALLVAPVALWITVATASILDGARRYGF